MNRYYSSFVPGLSEPVEKALIETIPQCKVRLVLDGLIEYDSAVSIEAVRSLPFVTNTFYVLKDFPRQPNRTLKDIALKLLNDRELVIKNPFHTKRSDTFRVIVSLANQLMPLEGHIMQALEKRIVSQTGLHPNRSKPDHEFWLLQRAEGYGFFSLRLSRHKAYDKLLQKGELRPELANILCRLSEPVSGELFLDPFCGSGAIPIQRSRFPTGLIIASDIDKMKIETLKERVKELGLKKKIVVRQDNALNLYRYEANSIHKIVTDPPWGHFEALGMPITEFYDKMVMELYRILTLNGRLVILTAQSDLLEGSAQRLASKLRIIKKLHILLSGKKASIYVVVKNAANQ